MVEREYIYILCANQTMYRNNSKWSIPLDPIIQRVAILPTTHLYSVVLDVVLVRGS